MSVSYEVDLDEARERIELLRQAFGKIPKTFEKEARRALREIASDVVATAKANASFSGRIPGAIKVSTRMGQSRRPGVLITVSNGPATPHARPLESIVRGAVPFRHPVFADEWNQTRREWTWVAQMPRPYVLPALDEHQDYAVAAMLNTIYTILRASGMRI